MASIAKSFFEDLFISKVAFTNMNHILSGVNKCVKNETNIELIKVFTKEEIK